MSNREIQFTSLDSKNVLTFTVGPNNRVSWQTTPEGEQGTSRAFTSPAEAGRFINSCASLKGYERMPHFVPFGHPVVCASQAAKGERITVFPAGQRASSFTAEVISRRQGQERVHIIVERQGERGRERLSIGGGTAIIRGVLEQPLSTNPCLDINSSVLPQVLRERLVPVEEKVDATEIKYWTGRIPPSKRFYKADSF